MAFYMLNPKTMTKYKFRNLEFYPAFLFLPKECFVHYPSILARVPRNPRKLFKDKKAMEFIASDEFLLTIIDFYAIAVWPFISSFFDLDPKMETYSGYDAAWMTAHCATLWVRTLEDNNYIPRMSYFLANVKDENEYFGFITPTEFYMILEEIVPIALDNSGLDEMIEEHKGHRTQEDFDYRDSYDKIDMHRKWYHTRSRFQTISLEGFMEDYEENNDGMDWDIYDPNIDIDLFVIAKIFTEDFLKLLNEKDRRILELRMSEMTYKEVAEILGYKNHSGVIKRMAKIRELFIDSMDEDYHLETYLKPQYRDELRKEEDPKEGPTEGPAEDPEESPEEGSEETSE